MKYFKALAVGLLLSGALVAAPAAVWAENISVSPLSFDFGEVDVGASSDVKTLHASSLGPTAVWIYLVQITPDATDALICGEDGVTCDFSITSAPALPLELPAGESVEVGVKFTPSATGSHEAYLNIVSNDADGEDDLFLPLTGVGVEPEPNDPAAMMAALLDFFDESVAAGMLSGIGPGRSAEHRLDAYRMMLVTTANLIDGEADLLACSELQVVRHKADGAPRPPDFVDGPAREELLTRINGVREALGCPT